MELTDVLRGGRQCDEDGTEIIMSRQACCEAADEIERLQAIVARVEAVTAEFEGMTGSGYRYMAAHVRDAIKVPNK